MNFENYKEAVSALGYGKRLPGAVYVFRPTEAQVPGSLFSLLRRAEQAAKPNSDWNLLKLHLREFALTFLVYPDFDIDPHPSLASSVKINLHTGGISASDFSRRTNPPILHRKETFLPPGDSRIGLFRELTRAEEEAGLYEIVSQIGLKIQWQTLLNRKGLCYEGGQLVQAQKRRETQNVLIAPSIERHRTAIKRYDLSKPVKILIEKGLLKKSDSFFDFGCGHGMDVQGLAELGHQSHGWDPVFRPDAEKRPASVVNLGYVLNVIENPNERIETLKDAFSLCKRLLLVSTLVTGQETCAHTRQFGDGFLTSTNTFQKFYEPGELENLIEGTLGVEAVTLTLGICVAFRDPDDAEQFAAQRNRRRIDWLDISTHLRFSEPKARVRRIATRYELHRDLLDRYWNLMLELGRPPEPWEFDFSSEVRRATGSLKKALSLLVSIHGAEAMSHARKVREEDVIVYLAMTNFRKHFLRRDIPRRTLVDIRYFFGDVSMAKAKARELLFAAGDLDEVALAVESLRFGVWDSVEQQLTFHRKHLDLLPPILRVLVYCGAVRYGNPELADLIKIHIRSNKVTFLHYENFEEVEAPILIKRIKINLRTQFVQIFDHAGEKRKLMNKSTYLSVR